MNKSLATAIALALLTASTAASAFECESIGIDASVCAKAKACDAQPNSGTCQADAAEIFKAGKAAANGEFGVRIDVISGSELIDIAAKNGSAEANAARGEMYNKVGNALFFGENMPSDVTKAIEWYKRAAITGHADAAYNLGCMYAWGEGVAEDKLEARKWLEMAIKLGNTAANHVLKTL